MASSDSNEVPTPSAPGAAGSIFLIGPMGSGKSAVGKALAQMRGLGFIDSDREIERRTGVDVALIFEKEGEAGFRNREREVIEHLTRLPGVVLATGGGAVLLAENREWLRSRGIVVYLEASVAQQVERTRYARHRPLLADVDPQTRLADLMRAREALYRSIAHITVTTDRRKVRTVAAHIATALDEFERTAAPPVGGAAGDSA